VATFELPLLMGLKRRIRLGFWHGSFAKGLHPGGIAGKERISQAPRQREVAWRVVLGGQQPSARKGCERLGRRLPVAGKVEFAVPCEVVRVPNRMTRDEVGSREMLAGRKWDSDAA